MKRCLIIIFAIASIKTPAQNAGVSVADSVFDAELMKLLVQQSQRAAGHTFPTLTISAQYSRHRPFDDQPVYQRGPYDLAEQMFRSTYRYHLPMDAEERTAGENPVAQLAPQIPVRTVSVAPLPTPWYVCGMYVRSPQVGETPGSGGSALGGGDYLVRVAGIPVKYANDSLWLLTLMQRASADAIDGRPSPRDNTVTYKKLVCFHGGESLTLLLPKVDPTDETVEEITLTHEPPQGFGLAQNIPNPVETRGMFAYAVPSQSTARLTILKPDGSLVDTIANGVVEAGVYRAVWEAGDAAPGGYLCAMEATPTTGGAPYLKQLTFSRIPKSATPVSFPSTADSVTEYFPVATIPLENQRATRIFRVMVEGGAAVLSPSKASSPLDNMFSHVAISAGFAINQTFEAGLIFGQDGFHVARDNVNPIIIPSTNEAVETRVAAWYGGYGRIYFAPGNGRGFFHASIASASGGVVSTFGIGYSITLSGGLSMYILPHRTDQWYTNPSTKWGANYGIAFLF